MRNLKFLLLASLLLVAVAAHAQVATQAPQSTETVMTYAKAKALKEKKSIWVVFGASW